MAYATLVSKGDHMDIYNYTMTTGITRSPEFEKKRLAMYAVNPGLKCGHGCTYCSTGAMLRTHRVFKSIGRSPHDNTYAIVDPDTPDRVAHDAKRIQKRGMIQLSTIVDAWAPEAQKYDIGRRCLEAILKEPGWSVRILTKNAAMREDFDIIHKHADRVLVGLSITAIPAKEDIVGVIEPHASSITERIAVLEEAHSRGIRTYAMFCPLLPGIADSPDDIQDLVHLANMIGAEEIFVEALNPHRRELILTQKVLQETGHGDEAAVICWIRTKCAWSANVRYLVKQVQQGVRHRYSNTERLRFLLYPKALLQEDLSAIQNDDGGVVWLT
jgi:DNA repair photolyase